jgi:acyl-CoA thioester hydrolase
MTATEPARAPRPEDYLARYTITTRLNDHDQYDHVNNAIYYEYVDTAVNGWLIDATGVDVRQLDAIGLVVASGCDFLSEVRFPDLLDVRLRVERLGTTSIEYAAAVFIERDDGPVPAARARFVHVYVDRVSRRPTDIPDVVRRAAQGIAVSAAIVETSPHRATADR